MLIATLSGADDGPLPGANVTTRAGVIGARCGDGGDCSCWPKSNSSHLTLAAPDTPVVPVASLVGATRVGSCSDVEIDASASTGSGGREWAAVEWFVNVTGDANGHHVNLTQVRAVAARASARKSTVLEVASAALTAGEVYVVSVRLLNYLGGELTSERFEVHVENDAIPVLFITGGSQQTHYAPKTLALFADAAIAVCPGRTAPSGVAATLVFSWVVVSHPKLSSVSVDPRFFKLPALTLNASTTYEIQAMVVQTALNLNSTALVTLAVGASPLIALIDGSERVVGTSLDLELDATASYSPDDKTGRTGADGGLAFEWRCFLNSSDSLDSDLTCPGSMMDAMVSQELVTLQASSLVPGVYTFRVEVFLSGKNASSSVTITVVDTSLPSVSITPLAVSKVNPTDRLVLEGRIGLVNYATTATWELLFGDLADESGDVDSTTRFAETALTATEAGIAAGDSVIIYLVLPSGALTDGASYSFGLRATYGDGEGDDSGSAVIDVVANSAPTSGSLVLSPRSGVVLETAFTFVCDGWADDSDDLPLRYALFYSIIGPDAVSDDGSTIEYPLAAESLATRYVGALLPRGGGNESAVDGICYIADRLNARARTADQVSVYASNGGSVVSAGADAITDLANTTNTLLNTYFESGDVEGMMMVVVASASALNTPNCSAARCAALNREPCVDTEFCGECMTDFVGPDSRLTTDVACWQVSSSSGVRRRRLLAHSSCDDGITNRNETDVDCGGGVCSPCALDMHCAIDSDCTQLRCTNGLCVSPPKPCVFNCSGHGACSHYAGFQPLAPRDCTIEDWWCDARCMCNDGWYGQACTLDSTTNSATIAMRNNLLLGLSDVVGLQDPDAAAADAQASGLYSVIASASAPEQLDERAQYTALQLLSTASGTAANPADRLMPGSSTVAALAASLNGLLATSLLAKPNQTTEQNDVTVGAVADNVAGAMLIGTVAGEAASGVATTRVQIAAQRSWIGALSETALSVPRTASQAAANAEMPAAIINLLASSSSSTGEDALDSSMVQWAYDIHGQRANDTSAVAIQSSVVTIGLYDAGTGSGSSDDDGLDGSAQRHGRRKGRRLVASNGIAELEDDRRKLVVSADLSTVTIVIPNLAGSVEYGNISHSNATMQCPAGFYGTLFAECSGATTTDQPAAIQFTCEGDAVRMVVPCVTRATADCARWNANRVQWDTEGAGACRVGAISPTNTTCICDAAAVLSSDSDDDDGGYGPSDFGATQVARTFIGNVEQAFSASCGSLSDCAAAAREVLIALAIIYGISALALTHAIRSDSADEVQRVRRLISMPMLKQNLAALRHPIVREYVQFVLNSRHDAEATATAGMGGEALNQAPMVRVMPSGWERLAHSRVARLMSCSASKSWRSSTAFRVERSKALVETAKVLVYFPSISEWLENAPAPQTEGFAKLRQTFELEEAKEIVADEHAAQREISLRLSYARWGGGGDDGTTAEESTEGGAAQKRPGRFKNSRANFTRWRKALAEEHELISLFYAKAGGVEKNGIIATTGRAAVTRTQRAYIFLTSSVSLLFVSCLLYDPEEDYLSDGASIPEWPSCEFSLSAATGDDDGVAFCPRVLLDAAAENFFETFWVTLLCMPIAAVLGRAMDAIGAPERLRKQFQSRNGEIAAVGNDVLRALDSHSLSELRRCEMEVAALFDLFRAARDLGIGVKSSDTDGIDEDFVQFIQISDTDEVDSFLNSFLVC